MTARRHSAFILATLLVVCSASACISRGVDVSRLAVRRNDGTVIHDPVKAHLVDGTIIVFPTGIIVRDRLAVGSGRRYTATLRESTLVTNVTLDSIAAMERFTTHYNHGRSVLYTTLATAGGTFAVLAGALAACLATPSCRLM